MDFEWYHELFQVAKQNNRDTTTTLDDSAALELRKLCESNQKNGETSLMYVFFDDRLYFGNDGLRYIGK